MYKAWNPVARLPTSTPKRILMLAPVRLFIKHLPRGSSTGTRMLLRWACDQCTFLNTPQQQTCIYVIETDILSDKGGGVDDNQRHLKKQGRHVLARGMGAAV